MFMFCASAVGYKQNEHRLKCMQRTGGAHQTCVETLKDKPANTIRVIWFEELTNDNKRDCRVKKKSHRMYNIGRKKESRKFSWKESNKNIDNMLGACSSSIFVS